MIEEKQAHQIACVLHLVGERVVGTTGPQTATRMIMTEGYHCGIAHDGLLNDYSHVDGCFGETTTGYSHLLYQLEILIHQQHPSFLHIKVLHHRVHLLIDGKC